MVKAELYTLQIASVEFGGKGERQESRIDGQWRYQGHKKGGQS
jgi:hypothetical protein